MKIITNDKLITRNKTIGKYATFASLGILAIGLLVAFNNKNDVNSLRLSFGALIVGFILSQVGIYYGTRFGRSPAHYEALNQCLKGLDDKYSLYHYKTPTPHLLVGPAGIWVLGVYHHAGEISFDEKRNRYKQGGRSTINKLFSQEGIGRPELEVKAFQDDIKKYLQKQTGTQDEFDVKAAIVFTNESAKVQAPDAPFPTMNGEKIKDFIRKQAKEAPFSELTLSQIKTSLPVE
jgi:hypothetical protein